MASITLNSVDFQVPAFSSGTRPLVNQTATVRYRPANVADIPANYINVTANANVVPDNPQASTTTATFEFANTSGIATPLQFTIQNYNSSLDYVVWVTNNCTGAGVKFTFVSVFRISPEPVNQTVIQGASATFTSGAIGGTGSITYQWQQSTNNGTSWTNISGATSTSYTFTNTQLNQNELAVRLAASQGGNVIYSTLARLYVTAQTNVLQITQQPTAQSVNSGSTATFTGLATAGSGSVTYQWQVNTGSGFVNISGATSNSYSVTNAQVSQSGYQYRFIATGTGTTPSTITSDAVGLTVTQVQLQAPGLIIQRSAYTVRHEATTHAGDATIVFQTSTDQNFPNTSATTTQTSAVTGGTTIYLKEFEGYQPNTLLYLRAKTQAPGLPDSPWTATFSLNTMRNVRDKDNNVAGDGVTFTYGNNAFQEFHHDPKTNTQITASVMKIFEGGTQVAKVDFVDDYLNEECAIVRTDGTIWYGPNGHTNQLFTNGNITT